MCQRQESKVRTASCDTFAYKVVRYDRVNGGYISVYSPELRASQIEHSALYGKTECYKLLRTVGAPFGRTAGIYALLFKDDARCFSRDRSYLTTVLYVKIPKGTRYITGDAYGLTSIRTELVIPLEEIEQHAYA